MVGLGRMGGKPCAPGFGERDTRRRLHPPRGPSRLGSVIRSWLIDLMEEAYLREGGLEGTPAVIDDTGEVNWLIGDATRIEVDVPVMAQAAMQLFASRDDKKHWARSIAMMRNGFGGHRSTFWGQPWRRGGQADRVAATMSEVGCPEPRDREKYVT